MPYRPVMQKVAAIALAGLAVATAAASASAQTVQTPNSAMTLEGRGLALSGAELRALSDLNRARTMSAAFQDRALAEAERVAGSADALYVLALYRFDIGQRRRDDRLLAQALPVLISRAATSPAKLAGYLAIRGGIAFRGNDAAAAAADWQRVTELRPGDAQALVNLAQARNALGDAPGAADLLRRASSAGQGPAPETWIRQWLSIAFNGRLQRETVAAAQALVSAYPTQANWRLALDLYRQIAAPAGEAEIAVFRLMRAANAMPRAAEYQRLAQLLLQAGDPVQARATLDDGIARGQLRADKPPVPDILRAIAQAQPAQSSSEEGLAGAERALLRGDRADGEQRMRRIAAATNDWEGDLAGFWLIRLRQTVTR